MLMKIRSRIDQLHFPFWTIPIALLLLIFLTFGILINKLGFYWDDWAKTLVHHIYGLEGYWDYYAEDRPFSGWTHILLFPILGDSPLVWQIANIILRWAGAAALWWSLCSLWPSSKRSATLTAFLYAIYPVFTMQPIGVTFHQQWMQYLFFFLSLGFMIQAYRKPSRFWLYTLLACILIPAQLTITEYYAPIELIRPFIFWILISADYRSIKQRIIQLIKYSLPYLIIITSYVIWRLFFIKLPGEDPYKADLFYNFFSQPIATSIQLIKLLIPDTIYMLLSNWANVIQLGISDPDLTTNGLIWIFSFIIAALFAFYITKLDIPSTPDKNSSNKWIQQALFIGLVAMLLGAMPAWITGRQVIFDAHSNRYAQPAMFGLSLIWIAIIEWLIPRKLQATIFLCALIGLSATFHIRTAKEFSLIWKNEVNFFWQLHWRAPHIEPQTAIFLEEDPFPNQGLFSTSSALNILYPQKSNPEYVAYWIYTLQPKFTNIDTKPEIKVNTSFRTLSFQGKIPDSLLVYYDPGKPHCMWMITPYDTDNPDISNLLKKWLYISNLDRIYREPLAKGYPQTEIIGKEPQNSWCYYYQKAELARQFEDWQEIINLDEEARKIGYSPTNAPSNVPHEWLPIIEGYANLGNIDKAKEITEQILSIDPNYTSRICNLWKRVEDNQVKDISENEIIEIYEELNCSP